MSKSESSESSSSDQITHSPSQCRPIIHFTVQLRMHTHGLAIDICLSVCQMHGLQQNEIIVCRSFNTIQHSDVSSFLRSNFVISARMNVLNLSKVVFSDMVIFADVTGNERHLHLSIIIIIIVYYTEATKHKNTITQEDSKK